MKKSIKFIAILMLSSLPLVSCTDIDEDDDFYLDKNQTELVTDSGDEGDPPPPPPPPPGD